MAWTGMANSNAGLVRHLKRVGLIKSSEVESAMRKIDRGNYTSSPDAYHDRPQGIGFGATISAPHMHAHCLELLRGHLRHGSKTLDVGSGSGYLTACFAALVQPLCGKAFGIEHVPQLVQRSIVNVKNDAPELIDEGVIQFQVGDGYMGIPSEAPFDCIHVGAAAPIIPQALVEQLSIGGRMVIPVGPQNGEQYLMVVDKVRDQNEKGYSLAQQAVESVRYVPLTTVENQLRI